MPENVAKRPLPGIDSKLSIETEGRSFPTLWSTTALQKIEDICDQHFPKRTFTKNSPCKKVIKERTNNPVNLASVR